MLIETMDGASLRAEIDALSQMLHLAVADDPSTLDPTTYMYKWLT